MAEPDDTPEHLPRTADFAEADSFQIGFEPEGGVVINLVRFADGAPEIFARVFIDPDEADALGRFLMARREIHEEVVRAGDGGSKH